MKYAKLVFLIGGIYGLLALIPLYFIENQIAPGLNYPEYYYGFIGINIVWQISYIYIATNPSKFRPIILFAFLVKILGVISISWLILTKRTETWWYGIIISDLVFAVLFLTAFIRTGRILKNTSPV